MKTFDEWINEEIHPGVYRYHYIPRDQFQLARYVYEQAMIEFSKESTLWFRPQK